MLCKKKKKNVNYTNANYANSIKVTYTRDM